MSDAIFHQTLQIEATRPNKIRGWLEVLSVTFLIPVGAILGSLTGFQPMSAICAITLPLLAATLYLRHEKVRWRSLVIGTPHGPLQYAGFVVVAIFGTIATVYVATLFLQNIVGLPPIDASAFAILEGNLTMYLWLLIPVSWGSAAIGEEMLVRGYLIHRLEQLGGTKVAIVLQAIIFSMAHFYQGITGVVTIFILSLVFAAVYVRSGRNLLPLIIADGCIDTYAMTALYLGRADLIIGT